MYAFLPLAFRSAADWRATAIEAENLSELGDFSTKGAFGPDYWIIQAWSNHDPEEDADNFLAFPSATDVLLWLRFWLLPHLCRFAKSVDLATAAMKTIDEAPDGSNAVELLRHVLAPVAKYQDVYHVGGLMTAHAWLSYQGSVAEFRRTFADHEIHCVDGVWHMRQATWDAIWANCLANCREGLTLESVEEEADIERTS